MVEYTVPATNWNMMAAMLRTADRCPPGRDEVNDALVHAHLVPVPGDGTLTTRRLHRVQAQRLRGHADRALHTQLLGQPTSVDRPLPRLRSCTCGPSP
eukprot:gene5974-biopygen11811